MDSFYNLIKWIEKSLPDRLTDAFRCGRKRPEAYAGQEQEGADTGRQGAGNAKGCHINIHASPKKPVGDGKGEHAAKERNQNACHSAIYKSGPSDSLCP